MPKLRIGDAGHVSFLLLAPKVIATREVPIERDRFDNVLASVTEQVVDGTVETGETACYPARVVAVNGNLVNATGWNAVGDPVAWRDVRIGAAPVPLTDEGREDPAGHVFHLAGDCPFNR